MVAVLDQVAGRVDAAGAEVDRHHRLDAAPGAPTRELVDADLVGLDRAPGQVQPPSGARRPDRCRPPSGSRRRSCRPGSARSARPARGRGPATSLRNPSPSAVGVPGLVDAGVDAAAHVLHERAVQPRVHLADPERGSTVKEALSMVTLSGRCRRCLRRVCAGRAGRRRRAGCAPSIAEAIVSAYRMPNAPCTVARPTGIVMRSGLVSTSSGHSRSFHEPDEGEDGHRGDRRAAPAA